MKNAIHYSNPGDASSQDDSASAFPFIREVHTALQFEPGPTHDDRLDKVLLAIAHNRNAFLEAASVLLRTLAELPKELDAEGLHGLHTLLTQEVHTFTRLCEQANVRRDHMLAVRYVLCTALDEAISRRPWAGGEEGQTGIWSQLALLNQFHGESQGGRTVFLLIGRLANAPDEHMQVLELIHHVLSLGFMGDYRVQADGHRMIETIRHRLYTMVAASREPVTRELSTQWQGVGQGKFKLLRSIPVWVSASVLGLALFAQFSWYKYQLAAHSAAVQQRVESLARLQPPAAPPVRQPMQLNLVTLLRAEIAQGRVKVAEADDRAQLVLTGDGMFAGGLDQLSPSYLAILDKVAAALQQVGGTVRVIGHTDNLPIATPTVPNNQVLSEKRAQSVVALFQSRGLAAARLQGVGKGDTQPVASNATASGRAANRRVEIEVLASETQVPVAATLKN